MSDQAAVWYKTGETVFDEDLGRTVPVWLVRFESKCKVQSRAVTVREAESGGRLVAVSTLELHFPVSAPLVVSDDEVEVTESLDPQVTGRRYRVVAPVGKTYSTARRFHVEEV